MHPIDYAKLKEMFLEVLSNIDSFQTLKRIDEFKVNDKYVGDMFNYTIFENVKDQPPIFYQINSPYDTISQKSPQRALVFQAGELLQNIDYIQYAKVRTGLLSAMVISDLTTSAGLANKRVLFVGSGGIARRSLESLSRLTEIKKIDYTNRSGVTLDFENHAHEQEIEASYIELSEIDLGNYDVILMHTSSSDPLFNTTHKDQLKASTIILSFADLVELDPIFYDSEKANLIVDYAANLDLAKDIIKACESGYCKKDDFALYLDILAKKEELLLDPKKYTVFRSKGTPYQNIAMLKYLNKSC